MLIFSKLHNLLSNLIDVILKKIKFIFTLHYPLYLDVIEWVFLYCLLYSTLDCNIGPRRLPEINIGTSAKLLDR